MSRNQFGVCRVKPTKGQAKRIEQIARKHGVEFIEMTEPGRGYLSWFDGPNRGSPFDEAFARAVHEDLVAEELDCEKRG